MTRALWLFAAVATIASDLAAAEVIPPKPERYFNDYAAVVSREAGSRFNEQLAQFERETSDQVVVAVFPRMQTESDIADYTQRIAESWGVGRAEKNNGAVLFVFIEDRKMFIQVGRGLEGTLPDITAFDITERHIKPRFKQGDYEGGLAVGIDLIMKAIRGEYQGTGKTVAESGADDSGGSVPIWIVILIIIFFIFLSRRSRKRGWGYTGTGGPFLGGWGGSSSGGGWSSGSSSGGGFSGFSGGGGSFGGGGGGSSW